MKSRDKFVHLTTMTALFAAIIFAVTAYLPKIPIAGGTGGYVHFGDIFIYLAACILPFPYGAAAAVIGAGLSDALTGYIVWLPGTVITKAVMTLMFRNKTQKILTFKSIAGAFSAGLVNAAGYYLYEAIITMSFAVPIASLVFNLIQSAASIGIFAILSLALDHADVKNKLERGINNDKHQ